MSKVSLVKVVGAVLVVVGLLGFVNNPVLGVFEVDVVHNLVHLVTGALAFVLAKTEEGAVQYGKVFGVVYAVVAVWGLVSLDSLNSLMAVNSADNVLHVLLAVVFLWVGFAGKPAKSVRAE